MSAFPYCDSSNIESASNASRRLFIGILYISVGVVSIPICFFNLMVFGQKPNIRQSGYKLLCLAVVLDIVNLMNSAVMPGFLSLLNLSPCTGHLWTAWFARQHIVFWYAYCCTSIILAFNRMLIFMNAHLSRILFDRNRCWLWLLVIAAYPVVLICIDLNVDFLYDQNAGIIVDTTVNYVHLANNGTKVVLVTFQSLVMLVFLFRQMRQAGRNVDKCQIKISLMTLATAVLSIIGTAVFLAVRYIPEDISDGDNWGIIGESSWIMLHSGTGVVYLIFNKTVLDRLKKFARFGRKVTTYHNTTNSVFGGVQVRVNNLVNY